MVEGARLESVYTVTPYRGFESHPLRQSLDFHELIRTFVDERNLGMPGFTVV